MTVNSACPKCNFHNPAGARFCGNCGQTLEQSTSANASITAEIVCPQCGHQNDAEAQFCRDCGHALAIEEVRRRGRWWLWLLILLGLIIAGAAVALFVWPGVDILVPSTPEEQPTDVADESEDIRDIPEEDTEPAAEAAPTATASAGDTADILETAEAAVDELQIATLPPPLSNVEIPNQPVTYPDEWPADLRFPEQYSVVETESGPMPGDASAGWAAKYRFAGDPKSAADSLSSFFETNGWQIAEKEKLDAGGLVILLENEDGSQTGIVVIDPDPNQAGHSNILATVLQNAEQATETEAPEELLPENDEEPVSGRGGNADAGKAHYDMLCFACHGPNGEGIENLGKPFTTSEFLRERSDHEMVAFIKDGRPAGDPLNSTGVDCPPKGGNPALSEDDLLAIFAYVRTFNRPAGEVADGDSPLAVPTGTAFASPLFDTTVGENETVNNDVIVYDGDLTLESGAVVNGDVVVFNGDVITAGTIKGDLVIFDGDLDAEGDAVVNGDCVLLNGSIEDDSTSGISCTFSPMWTLPDIAAPTPDPDADIEVRSLAIAPRIDGYLGDWADFSAYESSYRVFNVGSWDGTEDVRAVWRLGWDQNNLYASILVEDDVHVQTQRGSTIFKGDGVSLQVDTQLDIDLGPGLSPDDYQINLSPGDFSDNPPEAYRFRGDSSGNLIDMVGHDIQISALPSGNGYTLEAAIPWSDIGVSPGLGLRMGIALNVNDNDTPGTAVQEVMMSHVSTRRFSDPSSWGVIILR